MLFLDDHYGRSPLSAGAPANSPRPNGRQDYTAARWFTKAANAFTQAIQTIQYTCQRIEEVKPS